MGSRPPMTICECLDGCVMHIRKDRNDDKFVSRRCTSVFFGYSDGQKGWKLFDLEREVFWVSREMWSLLNMNSHLSLSSIENLQKYNYLLSMLWKQIMMDTLWILVKIAPRPRKWPRSRSMGPRYVPWTGVPVRECSFNRINFQFDDRTKG